MKQLLNYQKEALAFINQFKKSLLALDMGLGKTFTGLNWLKDKYKNHLTIILVQSSKVNDWYNEASEIFDQNDLIIGKTINFVAELFKNNENYCNKILILSYNIFVGANKKEKHWIKKLPQNYLNLIIDESQCLKNHNSMISKNCLLLHPLSDYILLLSGDPLSSGYKDLFVQMKMVDCFNDAYRFKHFLEDFCITRILAGTSVPLIVGYKNIDFLLAHLKERAYFLKSEDALDLPEQTFIDVNVCNNNKYNQMLNEKVLTLNDEIILSDNSLKLMNNLRQLSCGFIYDSKHQSHLIDETKYKSLNDLINNHYNFVIFYNFKQEYEFIKKISKANSKNLITINGSLNNFEPTADYKNTIAAIQFQSGAKGVDGLQKNFNKMIILSPPLSGELYKQSLKRIHRLHQDNKCFYYLFKTNNSLDYKIYDCLNKTQDYTLKMFENDYNKN